jgi:hypothetical protein
MGKDGFHWNTTVMQALSTGMVNQSTINTALRRSIMTRMTAGAFDLIEQQMYTKIKADAVNASEHWAANLDAASQGLVLLRNQPGGLPLMGGKKLAVVGPHAVSTRGLFSDYYGDQICFDGTPHGFGRNFSCVPTLGQMLTQHNHEGETRVRSGAQITCGGGHLPSCGNGAAINEAMQAVQWADAIVLAIGTDTISVEHEGTDRKEVGLPPGLQQNLTAQVLASGKPVIMVVCNGGAVSIDNLLTPSSPAAIIEAFFPGFRGAEALARHIFGIDNRWGRLPYDILTTATAESYDITDYSMHNRSYRYLPQSTATVSWPFGYGLSLTNFSLALAATPERKNGAICVRATNTGPQAGDVVITAFFTPITASAGPSSERLVKQLWAFRRLALEPGARADVWFAVTPEDLKLVDEAGARVAAPGGYELSFSVGDGGGGDVKLEYQSAPAVANRAVATAAAAAGGDNSLKNVRNNLKTDDNNPDETGGAGFKLRHTFQSAKTDDDDITNAEPVVPLDTSLNTLPVGWYGARWPSRSDELIENMAKMTVLILMQEDGDCWTKCCPHAGVKPSPSIGPRTAQCGPWHNASAEPGCDSRCDQEGSQLAVFKRVKATARQAGSLPPHCMLYMNAVYIWPFDKSSALGSAVMVSDTQGNVHAETADPGLFPSFLWDFGKLGGQKAWLDIAIRGVVNGPADGVYADCYMSMPLFCHAPGPPSPGGAAGRSAKEAHKCFATNNRCKCALIANSTMGDQACDPSTCASQSDNATTTGKPSLHEEVDSAQVQAYHTGKPQTMKAAADAVAAAGGSFYSKQAPSDAPSPFGGNMNWLFFQAVGNRSTFYRDRGCSHDGCARMTPSLLIQRVKQVLANYKYVMVGTDDQLEQDVHNPQFDSSCSETALAMFLLAVEPGAVLLCQGWSNDFAQPLGMPTAATSTDRETGSWTRSFAHGAVATVRADGTGTVEWGQQTPSPNRVKTDDNHANNNVEQLHPAATVASPHGEPSCSAHPTDCTMQLQTALAPTVRFPASTSITQPLFLAHANHTELRLWGDAVGSPALRLKSDDIVDGAGTPTSIVIDWGTTLATTRTTPTCQVVVEPSMWPTSKIREQQLHWLSDLGVEASPVFWQSWFVYPHTGVAQLQPGHWDFSQITPLLDDMLNATRGRDLVLQFGTVPSWMQNGPVGDARRDYGSSMWNSTLVWDYNIWHEKGTPAHPAGVPRSFRNLQHVAEYFANLMAYYTAGGFVDSRTGKHYESDNHYDIPWFEFGNELEYGQTPELLTKQSDVVNAAVASIAPKTKFVGLGLANIDLAGPRNQGRPYFEYFLNSSNHAPGAPAVEAIDYHWYANPLNYSKGFEHTMFENVDTFIAEVKEFEVVRKALAPKTKTYLKELGTIAATPSNPAIDATPVPDAYWLASAAYWAYLWAQLALQEIDVASMSQLVGGPPKCTLADGTSCSSVGGWGGCVCSGDNYASVSMLGWDSGRPTARYYLLSMLVRAFGNRLKRLVGTEASAGGRTTGCIFAQGFEVTENDGSKVKKLLLVNKRAEAVVASAIRCGPECCFRCIESSGGNAWQAPTVAPLQPNASVSLASFGVAILTERHCART